MHLKGISSEGEFIFFLSERNTKQAALTFKLNLDTLSVVEAPFLHAMRAFPRVLTNTEFVHLYPWLLIRPHLTHVAIVAMEETFTLK